MAKDIATNPIGGNSNVAAVHFDEDSAKFPNGTAATQYSGVFDLGESLGGNYLAVRNGDTPLALGTGAAAITILVSDDKNAASTSTAWATAATFNATGTLAAGAVIGKFVPAPGDAKKYWMAKATGVAGITDGEIGVYNESNPLAARG